MRSKLFSVLILLGMISMFILAPIAKAEDNVAGVIISPPLKEREMKAGTSYSDIIRVTNPNATADLRVMISVEDFIAEGEEGKQAFLNPDDNTSRYSLGKWINIGKELTLKANETKEIRYAIAVPENAEPGGHYGVIFFSPSLIKKGQPVTGSGVMAVPKVGGLILLTVPGDIAYGGNIIEFETDRKLFLNNENLIKFLTRFENQSTVHVKVQGDIVVKNILGREVAKIKVNETSRNTLPESISRFNNEWKKKYGFLRYSAAVNLAFGKNQIATGDLTFWIIPWKLVLIVLVILILLIWILKHLHWGGGGKNKASAESKITPMTTPVE